MIVKYKKHVANVKPWDRVVVGVTMGRELVWVDVILERIRDPWKMDYVQKIDGFLRENQVSIIFYFTYIY